MGIEYEIKLRLPMRLSNLKIEKCIDGISGLTHGPWSEHLQENTYFDSSDGGLRRDHVVLRHRRVDDLHVITVKCRAETEGHHEWEGEFDGGSVIEALHGLNIEKNLPPLVDLMEERTLPVAVANTDYVRRRCDAEFRQSRMEIAIDRGELARKDRSLRFAELEIELKSGDTQDVRDLAEQIRRRLSLRYERRGKYSRALALCADED